MKRPKKNHRSRVNEQVRGRVVGGPFSYAEAVRAAGKEVVDKIFGMKKKGVERKREEKRRKSTTLSQRQINPAPPVQASLVERPALIEVDMHGTRQG